MKQISAEFITGARKLEQFPQSKLPEIAFAGRSNVGKSSLLNSLVLRKGLAKISSTPGKTKEINFFNIENMMLFADLPGFGYAHSSKQLRLELEKFNLQYIKNRENLRLVCLLSDSRHEPMELDLALIELLEIEKKKFIIILTKCDKINAKMVLERKTQLESLVSQCQNCVEVLPFSAVSGLGRNELFAIIKKVISK